MQLNDQCNLDKAPRLSIRIVIWILPSDTVFVNSIKYQQIMRRQGYLMQLGAMHSVHCTQNYSSNILQLTRMVDSTSIDKNGWFWYFYRQDWLILPKQRINILGDTCHFGDEKQQNGSPNQQNVNPYQQSGSQKREISWYISTIGVQETTKWVTRPVSALWRQMEKTSRRLFIIYYIRNLQNHYPPTSRT